MFRISPSSKWKPNITQGRRSQHMTSSLRACENGLRRHVKRIDGERRVWGITRSNRARTRPRPPAVTADTKRSASGCTSAAATEALSEAVFFNPTRPTRNELKRATRIIARLKAAPAGIIKNRGQPTPPKPKVVACAIALQLNEAFADDRAIYRKLSCKSVSHGHQHTTI